jgi:hypothetical protein
MQNIKLHLNLRSTLEMARKKDTLSDSFDVAPHSSGMEKKWQKRACETWSEMPPRKMVRRGIHFRFVKRPPSMVLSFIR